MRLVPSILFTFFLTSSILIGSLESRKLHREDGKFPSDCDKGTKGAKSAVSLRVLGGTDAKPGQFPSYVALKITDSGDEVRECGGVLISDQFILSAAHCFIWGVTQHIEAVPGIWGPRSWEERGLKSLRVDSGCIAKGFTHEQVGSDRIQDYAVLKLDERVQLSKDVNVACLPTRPLPYYLRGHTLATGQFSETSANYSQRVKAVPTRRDDCKKYGWTHKSRICFSSANYDGDICDGDSGGPTLMEVDGKQCVYGISSFKRGSDCTKGPNKMWGALDVYNRVEEIKSLMENCPPKGEDMSNDMLTLFL